MMGSNMNYYSRNIQQVASDDKVIHISYDNLIPGEYEKRVIFGNMCPSLVGMRCIFEGNDADVFYITAGLSRFDEYAAREVDSMQSFLGMILNVLKAVRDCANYLIPENEVSLRSENIFFSEMNGSAKLMYLPGFVRDGSIGTEAVMLTERAERLCGAGMLQREALEAYRGRLAENENDIHEMIAITEEAMRRTYNIAYDQAAVQSSGQPAHQYQASAASEQRGLYDIGSIAPLNEISLEKNRSEKNRTEKRPAVGEEPASYGTGGVIKRHIREFINELVS